MLRPSGSPVRVLAALAVLLVSLVALAGLARASTLTTGLQLIERNYLFAAELDAAQMLDDAVTYLERRLPELRVLDGGGAARVLSTGPCRLRIEPPPGAGVVDLETELVKVAAFLDACLAERPEDLPPTESLLLMGVLSKLDPYSTVFDQQRRTEHTIQFSGKLAGIGARIGTRSDRLMLLKVYPGSPADKAGLDDLDVVRRIDGSSTTNMLVSDAVERIRGRAGTVVRLTIEREGEPEPRVVAVTRGIVKIPSVTVRRLESDVIHAIISHFSQTTPSDFRHNVLEAVNGKKTNGVIIDLRANSGGSMLGSSAIADLFLDEGVLITTAGRNGTIVSGLTAEVRATGDTPFRELPVAVMTSPRTASGSELLAASLRNHDRAVLVGEHTFGKGTVQKTYGLDRDASLKMTVGHFLPNGLSIPGGGLTPDVEVRRFVILEDSVQVPAPRVPTGLPFWLETPPWLETTTLASSATLTLTRELDASTEEHEAEEPEDADAGRPDPVLEVADTLLARFGSVSAARTLHAGKDWLDARALAAEAEATAAFTSHGVDWRADPDRSRHRPLTPALEVSIEAEGGFLRAGEPSTVTVHLRNAGATPLFRVYGRVVSAARFMAGRGLLFGHIAPGQTRSWKLEVEPSAREHTGRAKLTIALFDDGGSLAESGPMYLAVQSAPQPHLAHRIEIGVGEEPGDLELAVEIKNLGRATSGEVRVYLRHPDSDDIELVEASGRIEALEPDRSATVALALKMLRSVDPPPTLTLVVIEEELRSSYEAQIELVATHGFTAWSEPPSVRVRGIVEDAGGYYRLLAEAEDESGLAAVWCSIDGHKVDYVDSRARPRRRIRVELPWTPSDEVQRVEIVATDSRGLRTAYTTDL